MNNKIFKAFIHPFLFGIYPLLFLYSHNIYDTQSSQLFVPLIIIITITIFLIISLRFLLRNNEKTGVIISLFYMLLFSYQSLYSFISKLIYGTDLDIVIASVEIIFLGICIFFIVRSKNRFTVLTGFLNVFSIALISFSLFNITVFAFTNSNDTLSFKEIGHLEIQDDLNPEELPNIYHIILDAYGRKDVLKEYYKYDNSEFIEYLQSKNFYVASKSVANYSKTFLSLGSMLNLNYINEMLPEMDPKSNDKSIWDYPIRDFLFFKLIKKFGYNIYALSSGYLPTELINADVYKNQGYTKEFDNLLFNTTLFAPLVARLDKNWDRYSFRRNKIIGAFENLKNMPKFSSPTYIFAHVPSPHPPVIFDEHGNPIPDHEKVRSREGYYEEYGDQITYVNTEIKEIIDTILANAERPTIILLQGDHGLRSHEYWYDVDNRTNFKESLSILNAFYFHDGNYENLYENITPVNSFRVIFNQYMGTNFELLDDRSYLSVWLTPYDLVEYLEKDSADSLLE